MVFSLFCLKLIFYFHCFIQKEGVEIVTVSLKSEL